MSKIVRSVLVATVLAAGMAQMGAANAAPNDGNSVQSQRYGKQTGNARHFWDQMTRNGN